MLERPSPMTRVPLLYLVAAASLVGCAGGWTGEITELAACREDVGEGELSDVSAALERSGRDGQAELEWTLESFAAGSTTLSLRVEERGPARLIGGDGCVAPLTTSALRATVETADGALRETLEGVATVVAPDAVHVRLVRPGAELEGQGVPPDGESALRVEATLSADGLHGTVTFDSGAEEEAGAPLALF